MEDFRALSTLEAYKIRSVAENYLSNPIRLLGDSLQIHLPLNTAQQSARPLILLINMYTSFTHTA